MPNLANNCSSVGVVTYSDFVRELFAASMGCLSTQVSTAVDQSGLAEVLVKN